MKRLPALLLLALAANAFCQIGNDSAITPDRLRAHLEFVANDLLEGRDTPSRGLDIACTYVATQLKLWGVKPAGDNGGYFQVLRYAKRSLDSSKTSFSINGAAKTWAKDFAPLANPGSAVNANLVFVGHGWKIPAMNIDPYASANVKGKLMVVLSGTPAGFDFRDRRGEKGKGAISPQDAAAEYGAVGILQIPNSSTLEAFDSYAARFTQPGRAQLLTPSDSQIVPTITLSKDVVLQLFDGEQTSGDDLLKAADDRTEPNSFALSGSKQVSFTVVANTEESHAFNVVGIVEGSDPSLKTEYVAMGAHIDHLGMGGNGPDTIFNGADDDGSGTVSVLEIAHAFASGPKPKRSLLFVWHCGEEKGLVGSSYFTDHPTVPLERIVAQLNIDMIGRSRKSGDTNPANKMLTDSNSIYVVGSKRISTELGEINESVNAKLNKLRFDYHYDEPNDPENIYMRSDHYNYAKHGIPIAFFFDGVHEDYHRPSDEVSKIDFVKMSKVAQTVYATAFTVANLDHRLKIDHPGG